MPELTDFLSEIDWCCLTQFISTWASSLSVLMLFPSWSDLLSKSNRQGFFRSRQGFFRSGDDVRFPVSWERGVILLSPWLMLPWTSMLSSGCKVLRFFNAQCQFSTEKTGAISDSTEKKDIPWSWWLRYVVVFSASLRASKRQWQNVPLPPPKQKSKGSSPSNHPQYWLGHTTVHTCELLTLSLRLIDCPQHRKPQPSCRDSNTVRS